jgi:hypothetical protein
MRRSRILPLRTPVYNESDLRMSGSGRNAAEIGKLRREEDWKEVGNSIADYVIYYFQSEPAVTNAIEMRLYEAAIERFRHRLPPEIIQMYVNAAIAKDAQDREKAALARKAGAARKAERSAQRAPVLSSPRRTAHP